MNVEICALLVLQNFLSFFRDRHLEIERSWVRVYPGAKLYHFFLTFLVLFVDFYITNIFSPWAVSSRVQRVHLHPLRFSNGCNAPVLKVAKTEDELIFMQKKCFPCDWSCESK